MQVSNSHRAQWLLQRLPRAGWEAASIVVMVVSVALFHTIWLTNLEAPHLRLTVPIALAISVLAFLLLFGDALRQLRRNESRASDALKMSQRQVEQMADNIQEVFWMVDPQSRPVLRVNQAYQTITGRPCWSLTSAPSSLRELVHPDDRPHVLEIVSEGIPRVPFDEQFRIVRPDRKIRWVWVRGVPVSDGFGKITQWMGTALDITSQKEAEEQVAANLALAKAATAEADALREATLGLTQDLHMNYVLDTLLRLVTTLISCEHAQLLLLEGPSRLLVARETPADSETPSLGHRVLEAPDFPFFRDLVIEQQSLFLPDTGQEPKWEKFEGHGGIGSWLSVPLIASGSTLGALAMGHRRAGTFTHEHLRLANSLAIPASAAIQNARLYERAAIYGKELEKRVVELAAAEKALQLCEGNCRVSEEKFSKVFRSSPVPFSITTPEEGRFVDVNPAFEQRYGYSRSELIGHTTRELGMWEDPSDRDLMMTYLRQGAPVRNAITRLRSKSGEIKCTAYSADWIQIDGHSCIFAISQDLLPREPDLGN